VTRVAAAFVLCLAWGRGVVAGQLSTESRSPQAVSSADLQSAIDNLGKLDYDIETSASRVVRRLQASLAVPALVDAAAKHTDGYVQYRALVLLTGFNDSRTVSSLLLEGGRRLSPPCVDSDVDREA
jgi:hypothetical protein